MHQLHKIGYEKPLLRLMIKSIFIVEKSSHIIVKPNIPNYAIKSTTKNDTVHRWTNLVRRLKIC